MTFHRLTVPTYPGGLLAGYDLINDPTHPSVGGSGVAAPADGPKNGGPNDGSYFVAFHEDGRALHYNRPARALAENTDILDDILRTGIPVPTFVDATAAGATSTHNIVGVVYVGKSGATNNQAQRDRLVRITDQSNNDLEVSGSKIVATLVHDGASVNVVGTQATGFRTNASVNVSPPIPNGTAYRVWFGTSNSFANISLVDKGPLFEEQMRLIQNVSGEVRSLFRQIHSETSVNQAWDAPFDSTIRSIASSGLNERYRRATLQPAGFISGDFNIAGAGAIITRDGQAVTIRTPATNTTPGTSWPDRNLAALKIESSSAKGVISSFTSNVGGDFGYWHESEFKSYTTSGVEVSREAPSGPGYMEVVPRDVRVSTTGGNNIYTRINDQADATLNPDSGVGQPDIGTIECAAGQHFCLTGPTRTAIRVGLDMIEVTFPGGAVQTFIVDTIVSGTRVLVCSLRGVQADFGTVAVPGVRIRWIQPVVRAGGFYTGKSIGPLLDRVLTVVPPAVISDDPADERIPLCAIFAAVSDEAGSIDRTRALEWGVQQLSGSIVARGRLTAEGGIYCVLGSFSGDMIVGGDSSIGGDLAVTGGASATTVSATSVVADTVRMLSPMLQGVVHDDFLSVDSTADFVITPQSAWTRFGGSGTVSVQVPAISSKNVGIMRLRVTGGANNDDIFYHNNSGNFSDLQQADIVVAVDEGAGNTTTMLEVGFTDFADNNVLTIRYTSASGWRLYHRRAGVDGVNHNVSMGSFTDASFVRFQFLRGSTGLEIYRDGALVTTVLTADLPVGGASAAIGVTQTVADANAVNHDIDVFGYLFTSTEVREGPP